MHLNSINVLPYHPFGWISTRPMTTKQHNGGIRNSESLKGFAFIQTSNGPVGGVVLCPKEKITIVYPISMGCQICSDDGGSIP